MDLSAQLKHLDVTLLASVPTRFPEPLTDNERAVTHAYLVLAHAVLEEHLERVFERHFDRLASWLGSDMVPLEAARMVFAVGEWASYSVDVTYRKRSLHQLISKSVRKEFVELVAKNHGLKTANVEQLAKLVGLDWRKFEDDLSVELADLDNLGAKRGPAGHLSPYTEKVTALTASNDPDEIRRWVSAGREAVEAIETFLDKTMRTQQPASLISDWDGN